jgi:hypothetical protein
MKYILIILALIFGFVAAQTVNLQKTIGCISTEIMLKGLSGSDYKEKPIWMGIESDAPMSKYSLFVNDDTKTWTLIQFDEKIACVLGTGGFSTYIFTGPKI